MLVRGHLLLLLLLPQRRTCRGVEFTPCNPDLLHGHTGANNPPQHLLSMALRRLLEAPATTLGHTHTFTPRKLV